MRRWMTDVLFLMALRGVIAVGMKLFLSLFVLDLIALYRLSEGNSLKSEQGEKGPSVLCSFDAASTLQVLQ